MKYGLPILIVHMAACSILKFTMYFQIKTKDCVDLIGYRKINVMEQNYSGRTKYSAFVSKLNKLSEEYLSPQETQKAAVFFYWEDLGQ